MSNDIEDKLKEINTEDFIWVVYIFIILLSWYSNSKERKYFLYNDLKAKEDYRCLVTLIFTILVVVYLYFLKSSYEDFIKLKESDTYQKKYLTTLSLIASFLILVGGIIFLYIAVNDEKIEVELAFN